MDSNLYGAFPVRLFGADATGLPAALQLGNWTHMGNIAGRDHTSTKWWVRLEQGSSRSRVPRNRVLHSREQSPKPHRGTQAQDRGRERLVYERFSTNFGSSRNGNHYRHPVSTTPHVADDTADAVR
jgi:hypothetical protein